MQLFDGIVVRIQLQNSGSGEGKLRVHPLHILLHLKAHTGIGNHGGRVSAQILGQLYLLDLVAQALLDEGQEALLLLRFGLGSLLFLLGLETQVLGGHVAERLLLIGHQGLGHKLIHILGKEQCVKALAVQQGNLGELTEQLLVLAGGKVDLLLALSHGIHILLQGNELLLLMAVEQQQILAAVLVGAVVGNRTVLQLTAKGGVEFLVLLPVVVQHGLELALDLLFDVPGDDGQLAVVLQHFPADVQGKVLAVYHAPDKAEVLRQQILTGIHDHHAAGIELQAPLEVLGVEIVGCLGGDIQQGLEGNLALGAEVDHPQGLVVVVELILIEGVIFFLGHVLLILLPQGDHGVEGGHLGVAFVFGLILGRILLLPGLLHLHADGVADVVGILGDQVADFVLFQILVVGVLLGIGLQHHNHIGAGAIPLRFLNGIAVGALGDPLIGHIGAVFFGDHGHLGGHHKGRVEAHAELADDVNVVLLFHGLLEAQRAGLGDGAQILLHLLLGHTDAVIGNGQGSCFLIPGDGDGELIPIQSNFVIGQSRVGQLVDGIGGIGDNLPEEDLPVGIN